MRNLNTIGERIESAVHRANLLNQDVAKELNMSSSSFSQVTHDAKQLKADQLKKLCQLTDASSDWILGLK